MVLQADVTPERQAVLDRLSSGHVFPSSSALAGSRVGDEGGGSNGALRAPGDPPAPQPNLMGTTRYAAKSTPFIRRCEGLKAPELTKWKGSIKSSSSRTTMIVVEVVVVVIAIV